MGDVGVHPVDLPFPSQQLYPGSIHLAGYSTDRDKVKNGLENVFQNEPAHLILCSPFWDGSFCEQLENGILELFGCKKHRKKRRYGENSARYNGWGKEKLSTITGNYPAGMGY